jgi:pimeloyl-ACP methyl ester carboxylesterase
MFKRLPRRYASFDGDRLAYAVVGAGPPVMLLHGLGGTADFWQPVVARLAGEFTVICPDLLGFGFSDKPRRPYTLARHAGAVLAVARSASGQALRAIVGHSIGGVVTVALCALGALEIERVALAATPYPTPRFQVRQELVTRPWFNRLIDNRRLARADDAVFRAIWPLARRIASRRVPEDLQGGFVGFMDYSADSFYGTAEQLLFRSNIDPLLPALRKLPALLLYASDDATVPIIHGRRLAEQLPDSTFAELDGGHYAVLRAGLAPLADWLRSTS